MLFNLKKETDRQRFKSFVNKYYKENLVVELTAKKEQRTIKQNSYLHLLLSYFAAEYGCTADEAKIDFYKRTCNRDLFVVNKVNKYGQRITTLRSSTELDTKQMTDSIERFRNWSSMTAGIYLPSPNEPEGIVEMKQTVENNRYFL